MIRPVILVWLWLAASLVAGPSQVSVFGELAKLSGNGPSSVTVIASGVTYLLNQNFEGTGYDNGEPWTETGTPDEDYTTVVLKGAHSLNAVAGNYPQISVAAQSTTYFHCRIRFQVAFAVTTGIQLTNTAETVLCAINVASGGVVKLDAGGGLSAASATSASLNTTYYLWLDFVSGGTGVLAMSTTTTRPTADTGGNFYLTKTGAADSVTKVLLYSGSTGDVIFDNVILSASPIGDNPSP